MLRMRTIEGISTCLACTALGFAAQAEASVTLMDQIGAQDGTSVTASNSYTNQLFEPGFAVYDVAAIDDFDNGDGSTVQQVEVVITGWNGYSGVDGIQGVQVNFYDHYSDVAETGLKGYVSQDFMGVPTTDTFWGGAGNLIKASSEAGWELREGTQYLSLIPFNEYGLNGQVAVLGSSLGDGVAWQANPGFGFGQGPYWQIDANLACRVIGTDQPDDPDCPDTDGDGIVNVNDMLAVLDSWGDCPADGSCDGDVNRDGVVNVNDTLMVIGRWGNCQ